MGHGYEVDRHLVGRSSTPSIHAWLKLIKVLMGFKLQTSYCAH